ncbi:MAG: phenylalanine--tRNA ligase subunit alpha [Candidatus Taylorbacteria bacterium]|nr:phenylalanine--tRNA ligase subunit alpha [Candidatus Taylorbacteria bacterium]
MSAANSGHLHPITQVVRKAVSIFDKLGFEVAEGPELETEWYNFDALNIPADHPARDMQDTFWIKSQGLQTTSDQIKGKSDSMLLRTHTSSVQVRYMEKHNPPIRIIAPGKVFRNEATDSTHEAQFNQLEGLCIDTEVSLAQLKGTIERFMKEFLSEDAEIRFRPSYFPFTEPSIETDVKFNGKWMEVVPGGMVHPNVLKAAGIDPKKYRGFAFGMGIDRMVMVRYGISDIRTLYNGDLRLVNQF